MKNAKALLAELVSCYGRVAAFLDAAWQRLFGLPATVPVAVPGSWTASDARRASDAERMCGARLASRINDDRYEGFPKPPATNTGGMDEIDAELEAHRVRLQGEVDRYYAAVMRENPAEMAGFVDAMTMDWEDSHRRYLEAPYCGVIDEKRQMREIPAMYFLSNVTVLGMIDTMRRFRQNRANGGGK